MMLNLSKLNIYFSFEILKSQKINNLYRKDGKKLAPYLRAVAQELTRAADLLDGSADDSITFFDEVNKKVRVDYRNFRKSLQENNDSNINNNNEEKSHNSTNGLNVFNGIKENGIKGRTIIVNGN